jgi:hypothetical protein
MNGFGGTENTSADPHIRVQNKFGVRTQGSENTWLETTEGIGPERTVDLCVVSELKPGTFGDTDERSTDKGDATTD